MNRRNFLKTSVAITASAIIPMNIMADQPKNCFIEYTKQFKILNPRKGLIPFVATKHHEELANVYENNRFVMVKKYRQGGFTTTSILWALYKCVHEDNQTFLVVSKTDREAINNKRDILDHFLKQTDLTTIRNNQHFVEFENKNSISFITKEMTRGRAATCIIFDEAAFIPNLEQFHKVAYPCICTGGKMFMVSTPNGRNNYFHQLWESGDYYNYAPSCWDHPDYQNQDWVNNIKYNLGEIGFRSECLAEFI